MEVNLEETTQHAHWVFFAFLIGYIAIIVEEFIQLNKAATALLMATACWTILFLEPGDTSERHLYIFTFQMFKVSQVLFFIIGALAIVEIINVHKGFQIITKRLLISSKRIMLWMTALVTFFLSAILDNLTTTIVMISLLNKIVKEKEERLLLGGTIVIAANSGGVWTPIGDIATTLLWINGQLSTLATIRDLFIPSVIGLVASLFFLTPRFRGQYTETSIKLDEPEPGSLLVFILGICSLIFVPIFKVLTDLPAFMGMMLGLGLMWVVTDWLHYKHKERTHLRVTSILPKIDISVILFYLGILLSINSLESAGLLKSAAKWLNLYVQSPLIIPFFVGLLSCAVDNVALVASIIAMYDLKQFPIDSSFWQAITYCAGTGGSILIIGSAAGIALMALEQVTFMWYLRKITLAAIITYVAGFFVYLLINPLTHKLF